MRRHLHLPLVVALFVAPAALAADAKLDFGRVPVPKIDAVAARIASTVGFRAIGTLWGDAQDADQECDDEKTLEGSSSPLYNYYPLIELPKIPNLFDEVLKVFSLTVGGPELPPPGPALEFGPVPAGTGIADAVLRTFNGLTFPSLVTELTNLNDAPTLIDLGYGPIGYQWEFERYFAPEQLAPDFAGRYFLVETTVPVRDLVRIPEPASLFMLSALALVRVRARRRGSAAR